MYRKLVVRLKGGLGNQLFCYAAARRLALVNDAELVLDTVTGFKYDRLYRRSYALGAFQIPARFATASEQMEPLGRFRRLIVRKLSEQKPLAKRRYIQQVGVDFDPDILLLRLQDGTTYFDAFGQSEKYFYDARALLKEELIIQRPTDFYSLSLEKKIKESISVALHFRWFESENHPSSSNIQISYYKKAVEYINKNISNPLFFVFSDQPEKSERLLAEALGDFPRVVVNHKKDNNSSILDFWLMRQCKNFVIGNSTYAWWAAWLAELDNPASFIIAPARYINPMGNITAWGFPYLLPDRWIKFNE
jgi:hypothetical protein